MQDINLLQNKLKDNTNRWEKSNRVVLTILSLILLAMLASAGFFYAMKAQADKAKAELDRQNMELKSELARMEADLDDAKNFQAQSKNIATLLQSHVSWAEVIDEVTSSAYKSSQVFSLNSDTTGKVHLEGMAADYASVGKMLLALETSDQFNLVELLATSATEGETPGIMYSIDVYASPEIFIRNN